MQGANSDHEAVDRRASGPHHSDKAFDQLYRVGNQPTFCDEPDHHWLQLPARQGVEQCAFEDRVLRLSSPSVHHPREAVPASKASL
jgi:hypothetical protein